jgi:hypothetical protein
MRWKFLPGLMALFINIPALPQASDSAFVIVAQDNAKKLHQAALGSQARLYNGSKYREPELAPDFHPFFSSEDWITGSIYYDGEYFENVPLMYDLLNDAVITEHLPSGQAIQLIREKISLFSIGGHRFEKISDESRQSLPGTPDFLDVLYDGESKIVALRQKFRRDNIEGGKVHVTYEEKNRHFILRNGVFFPVKSKASLLKILSDRKQELKKHARQKGIFFSRDREGALQSLAKYYDTLR